jgi:D-cysteine desulfhydrase
MRLCGAEVEWCTAEDYLDRDEIMARMADEAKRVGRRPYVIPEGGSNALGAMGYMNAVTEIVEQLGASGLTFDTLVCAIGSGGTYAGLTLGRDLLEATFNIIGFNVCESAEYFEEQTARIRSELEELLDLQDKAKGRSREGLADAIIDGFVGPGYAEVSEGCAQAIYDVAHEEGIILDPAYTAKAFHGMRTCMKEGDRRFGKRVMFLHTGGIFGLFPRSADLVAALDL